jgi:hypothetical protein
VGDTDAGGINGSEGQGDGGEASELEAITYKTPSGAALPQGVRDSWAPVRFQPTRAGALQPFYRAMEVYLAREDLYDLGPPLALMDAATQVLLDRVDDEEPGGEWRKRLVTIMNEVTAARDMDKDEKAWRLFDRCLTYARRGADSDRALMQAVRVQERRSMRAEAARRVEIAEAQTITYKQCMEFVSTLYAAVRSELKNDPTTASRIIATVGRLAAERSGVVTAPSTEPVDVREEARAAVREVQEDDARVIAEAEALEAEAKSDRDRDRDRDRDSDSDRDSD